MDTVTSRARPWVVLACFAAVAAYVSMVDPDESGHYPTCPFLYLTGYYCPGCGSLRMVHALTHGQVSQGFGRNPLAFLMIPVLGYLWVRWVISSRRGEPLKSRLFDPRVIWAFTAVIMVFWVIRNLPFGHALAP
jgi:Protein of unknown function (DUF2752)